jgi:signal transduction histidine kinase/CheY-like chemotaxis protein
MSSLPVTRPLRPSGLQRDLIRLGVLPCAVAALALTLWFTHERLDALDAAFDTEGNAVARQMAVVSDLSLYAGDTATLRNMAQNTVDKGLASRVEISNGAGMTVTAGPPATALRHARAFGAPVRLRATRSLSDYPQLAPASGDIGSVRVYLDDSEHSRARAASFVTGGLVGGMALLLAWLSARHMARAVVRPLTRLSNTVSLLHGGNLDARCGPCGKHEIAGLATDIDLMAQRLQDNHSLLEARIRAATSEALARLTQAEQATRARTRFLATASHDLRQPVHAMGLFIDSLLPTATTVQLPAMQRLQEGTQVMSALLDALLDISRLDANVMSPQLAPVRVADLFTQLDAMHAPTARQAKVRLHWNGGTKAILTDQALAHRIVDNLVRNAVRHSEGGSVLVVARRCAAGVRIEVRDDGVGISSIHQTRIFEEFYQVANPQRDRRNGFGLGLSICSRIAKLLGTYIEVRSRLNGGSTFSVVFPAAPAEMAAPSPLMATPATSAPLRARCLLIDDDDAILEGTAALLRQWGCHTDQAQTGDEAMRWLDAAGAGYDVVLCDLQLRGNEDGMAIAELARARHPGTLVVLVSGTTTPEVLQRVRQASIALLTKPVAPAKLRALLATVRGG